MANKTGKTQPDFAVQEPFLIPYPDQRGISDGYVIQGDYNKASEFIDPKLEDLTLGGLFPMSRISPGGTYQFGDGSVSAPAISFSTDTDTGFYKAAASEIDVSIDGTRRLTFNASGLQIPGLTAGQIVFPDSSKNLTGSSSLFWDNTNARLGIGTSSPSRQLHLTGTASMRSEIQLTNAAASPKSWHLSCNGTSFTDANADFAITETGVAVQFKIKAAGEVDITQFTNIGTATDANAQGDLCAGLTGAARLFYDQSVPTLKLFASGGSNNVAFNVTSGGVLDITATGNVYEFVNGTSQQTVRIYNTTTSTRYFQITTFSGGSCQLDNSTAASTILMGGTATAILPGTDAGVNLGGASSRWQILHMSSGVNIYNASGDTVPLTQLSTSGFAFGPGGSTALDAFILRDGAAGTVGIRNGANAMVFRVYNTFTSSTNKEFGKLEWSSNVFNIGTEKGSGGGTARALTLMTDGTDWFGLSTTGSISLCKAANGQNVTIENVTELTTIAAAATTDTAIQIPVDAVVFAVSVRVTVAIPTAATFTVTGTTSGTQFDVAGGVAVAANTTDVGTRNCPYKNGAAQTIRITPNINPAANTGRVRVTIHYYKITVPTS